MTGRWTSIGCAAPASNASPAATAGSSRSYYGHDDGRWCYRTGAWWDGGVGVHGFYINGDGCLCDEWGRDLPGTPIPAAEFGG